MNTLTLKSVFWLEVTKIFQQNTLYLSENAEEYAVGNFIKINQLSSFGDYPKLVDKYLRFAFVY